MRDKTPRALTAEEQAALEAVAGIPDSVIDTSDMPEVADWSGAVRGPMTGDAKLACYSRPLAMASRRTASTRAL